MRHLAPLVFIIITATQCLMTIAIANTHYNIVTPGFYLNVELGYSTVDYKNHFAPGYFAQSVARDGYATRIEGGFDIYKNLGAVLSIIYFHKPEFHQVNNIINSKTENNIVFAALKGKLPVGPQWMIYIDAGFGYVGRSVVSIKGQIVFKNHLIIRPIYGLGLSYLLWKRWALTSTWIQAPQKLSKHLPTSNYVGAGIRYKFAS